MKPLTAADEDLLAMVPTKWELAHFIHVPNATLRRFVRRGVIQTKSEATGTCYRRPSPPHTLHARLATRLEELGYFKQNEVGGDVSYSLTRDGSHASFLLAPTHVHYSYRERRIKDGWEFRDVTFRSALMQLNNGSLGL